MITSSHPIFPIPKPEFFGAFWGFPYNHHPGGVNNHPVRFRLLPFRGMAQPEMLMLFCIKHFWKKKHEWIKMWRIWKCSYQFVVWNKLNCWKKKWTKNWLVLNNPTFFWSFSSQAAQFKLINKWAHLIGNNTQWINSNSPSSGWDDEWPSHIFSQDFGRSPMVGMWTKN